MPHEVLTFMGRVAATNGELVDLWHWPNCPRCGCSRYGGATVTAYCFTCEVMDRQRRPEAAE